MSQFLCVSLNRQLTTLKFYSQMCEKRSKLRSELLSEVENRACETPVPYLI